MVAESALKTNSSIEICPLKHGIVIVYVPLSVVMKIASNDLFKKVSDWLGVDS